MKDISLYIDRCIINEYATKSFHDGYSLDIDDVPENERAHLLDLLMKEDTSIRETVLLYMQKLIDERLPIVEVHDRDNAGLNLIHLSNGDTKLTRRGAAW